MVCLNKDNAVAVISMPTAAAFAIVDQDVEGNDVTKVEQIRDEIKAIAKRTTEIRKIAVNGDRTIFFCYDTGDDWLAYLTGNIELAACWKADIENNQMKLDERFSVTLQALKDNGVVIDVLDDGDQPTGEVRCVLSVSDGEVFKSGYELPVS